MNIIESLEWRYACKKFDKDRKISGEQLEALKKAFNLTATSYGLQPIKMIVISDRDTLDGLWPHTYYQQQVATCSHLLIICIDSSFGIKEVDDKFDLEKKIRNLDEEVVGKFRDQLKKIYAQKEREQIDRESMFQAYIAIGNLMTVCADMRVDSCPMEGFDSKKIDEALDLDRLRLKSALLLPVGFRSSDDPTNGMAKIRKPLEEVIIDLPA